MPRKESEVNPTYTAEVVSMVEELGGLGFTDEQIQIILNESPQDLPTHRLKGYLTSLYKVRKANYELALQGNSASIVLHLKTLEETQLQQNLHNLMQ
jgi:hypothetical protein